MERPPERPANAEAVRIDRWLVAARLARTRALAREACEGGKVHLNGRAVAAHRLVRRGDRLRISRSGRGRLEVLVLALAERRLDPTGARELYRLLASEGPPSAPGGAGPGAAALPAPRGGRPDKRDRRRLDRWSARQTRGGPGEGSL